MDDKDIISMYFSRDENAIAETQSKYGAYIKRVAFNVLGNEEDVLECENDTYFALWNNIPPENPANFGGYASAVARNTALKKYRDNSASVRNGKKIPFDEIEELIPDEKTLSDGLSRAELAEIMKGFLDTLQENERNVFLRRYWFCDSIKDVAKAFDFTEGRVKMMLMRTRNKLTKYLKKDGIIL